MVGRTLIAKFLIVVVFSILIPVAMASEQKETVAVEVALEWLAKVDSGNYAESWDGAAALFRGAVTKEQWVRSLEGARRPLGAVQSRDLENSAYVTELPDAPDGEYVIIEFATSYENKSGAVETVTPTLEEDGKWRVAGYYIK